MANESETISAAEIDLMLKELETEIMEEIKKVIVKLDPGESPSDYSTNPPSHNILLMEVDSIEEE